jgi:hypothetical protein
MTPTFEALEDHACAIEREGDLAAAQEAWLAAADHPHAGPYRRSRCLQLALYYSRERKRRVIREQERFIGTLRAALAACVPV